MSHLPDRRAQLAYKAGDPPEPPREIEPEGNATTLEYSLIWFPFHEIAGYIFDCPDKFKPEGGKTYREWEDKLMRGDPDGERGYVSMRNVFGYVWNCPAPPLIIKEASDLKFYCVRHNRIYCAYRTFERLGHLTEVLSARVLHEILYVPVRIAHPADKWGDSTRAALVHPVEQVDRGPEGSAWMDPYPEAIWPCPAEKIWRR